MLGLVTNRKRGHRMWNEKKKRMVKKKAEELGVNENDIVLEESLKGPMLWKMRYLTFKVREGVEIDEERLSKVKMEVGLKNLENPTLKTCVEGAKVVKKANHDVSKDIIQKKSSNNDISRLSVTSGEFDDIVNIKQWEEATNLTKDQVMSMLPAELKKRVWWKSTLYLIRAFVYCAVCTLLWKYMETVKFSVDVGMIAKSLGISSSSASMYFGDHLDISIPALLQSSSMFHFLFWSCYAMIQGALLTGIWVIGHECGHGAFSESTLLNDVVGLITHTPLLVPYYAWQFTHGKHHKFTNHLTFGETHVPPAKPTFLHKFANKVRHIPYMEDLVATTVDVFLHLVAGWPLYLWFNLTGGRTSWKNERLNKKSGPISHFIARNSEIFPPVWRKRVNISVVAVFAMVAFLTIWSDRYGFGHMLKWYFFPYLVTNAWLVLYTWLHHTHEEVPHYADESFNWLRGALSTIDRPYPSLIDHIHLHIGSTHVLHHLNSKIPHYHAKAATEILKNDILGPSLYRYDDRGIVEAMWGASKNCHYVDSVKGLQFYRAYGGSKFIRGVGGKEEKPLGEKKPSESDVSVAESNAESGLSAGVTSSHAAGDDTNDSTTTRPNESIKIPTDTIPVVSPTTEKPQDIKKETYIDGVVYDITGFVKKHPGGRIIEFVVGTDATDAFNQFHLRSQRAKKILKSLPQRKLTLNGPDDGSTTQDEEGTILELEKFTKLGDDSDSALTKELRDLSIELHKEGWFKPNPLHVVYRIGEIVLMYVLGMAMMYYSFNFTGTGSMFAGTSGNAGKTFEKNLIASLHSANPYLLDFLSVGILFGGILVDSMVFFSRIVVFFSGLFILGIAQGRCGWLQHEAGHYSLTGNIQLDRRLQELIYGFGTGI